jgi:hypothetical protein
VTKAVQNEWTNSSQAQSLPVLLLEAGRFDMPTKGLGRRIEHPSKPVRIAFLISTYGMDMGTFLVRAQPPPWADPSQSVIVGAATPEVVGCRAALSCYERRFT